MHESNHNSQFSTLNSQLKLSIRDWAEGDRPREKMARLGAQALSDAELLAILIGSGSPKESAVDLMKRVLADCNNNLNTLGKKTIHELTRYNGMGPAKAITILAACELGKRRQLEKAEERPDLGSATAIYNHLHPLMQDLDTEEACLEWHLHYEDPLNQMWQIDMIHILKGSRYDGYFEQMADRIVAALTDETRHTILQLKYETPESEKIMGIEYYQAVLRDGVKNYAEFETWRRQHPLTGIVTWMP